MSDVDHATTPHPSTDGGWLRLHPGTILDDALQRIPNVVIGGFLILTSGGGDAAIEIIQLLIGLAAVFPVVVRYLTGRYRIDSEVVQWRQGVFTKVHTDLPRHRIQTVDTRISVVGRAFGLESVVISSAGGESEITIGLIDSDTARMLRTELTPDPESAMRAADDGAGTDRSATVLADLGAGDLGRVVGVDVRRVLGLVAMVVAIVVIGVGLARGVFGFGSVIFAIPLGLSALGVARSVVTEAVGFSSRLVGDRIHVERGLVARSALDAPLKRVQGINVKRSFVARRIGTERISVDTADVSNEGNSQAGRSQILVHPIAAAGTWRPWAASFLGTDAPRDDELCRVAPVSLRRRWFAVVRASLVVWVLIAIAVMIVNRWIEAPLPAWIGTIIAVGTPIVGGTVATLRYRNERWALGDTQVLFLGGAITTSLSAIPRIRAQTTEISANWFQRRLGIADLTVDTASPTVEGTGRDLYLTDATRVAHAILATADAEGGV